MLSASGFCEVHRRFSEKQSARSTNEMKYSAYKAQNGGLRFPKSQVTSDGRKRLPTTKRLRQCRYAGAIRNICKAASAEPRAPAMSRSGTTANRTI
jgi:hypothetical protein